MKSRSLLVALISGGLGAASLQIVHAASPARPAGVTSVRQLDDYPNMRRALHDLRAARESLDNAEPHFKGHRDKAIGHVDQAIQECVDALAEG